MTATEIDELVVAPLDPVEDDYDRMLTRDPGNLLYAAAPFLAFIRTATGATIEVLGARRNGTLVGALPFAVLKRPDQRCIVNSLPWWGSHGSVVLERRESTSSGVREALLRAFVKRIDDVDLVSATMILLPEEEPWRQSYEDILIPTAMDARIGQISDLPQDGPDLEARLLAGFTQKTRNLVRKSLKQGFEETVSDEPWAWDFLHATHVTNVSALGGRPKPREHFAAIRDCLPVAMRRLSIAMDHDTPAAAMLTLQYNGTVEYITPAIDVAYRPRQPLSFLIIKGMIDAIERGAARWNWGGTWVDQPDLHHFKAGFGATDRPYTYLVRASDEGLRFMRERKAELTTLFPYFYCYPYSALDV